MGIDWEYLRSVVNKSDDWSKEEFEEVYQNVAGVTELRQRDKTLQKLELLFTLSQAVMIAKWNQVISLEAELENMADSAGRLDAERERDLLDVIDNLTQIIHSKETEDSKDDMPYDWSKGWRTKKQELESKLISKNHEIQQLVLDMNNNEKERLKLEQDLLELHSELSRSTSNLNALTSELLNLKDKLATSQGALKEAEEKIMSLEGRNSELKAVKIDLEEKYKELTFQVDQRLEKISKILHEKEKENEILREELRQIDQMRKSQDQINRNDADEEGEHYQDIIEKKNQEISVLTQKLSEATEEIEANSEYFATLKRNKSSMEGIESNIVSKLRNDLHESELQIRRLERQLTAAEDDAQLHAQDLATVLSELKMFMLGEYSLADAVAELKEVRRQVAIRDSQIQELTSELNAMQINVSTFYDENTELREQLSLEPKSDIDLPNVNETDWKNSKKIIENLTSEVLTLQEEKISLRAKIYELTRTISDLKNALDLGSTQGGVRVDSDHLGSMKNQIDQLHSMVTELTKNQKPKQEEEEETEQKEKFSHQSLSEELLVLKEDYLKLEIEKNSLEKLIQFMRRSSESFEELDPQENLEDNQMHKNLRKYHKILKKLPLSAQETLARLKSQVQFLLEEISLKESKVQKGENDLVSYRTQFESLYGEVSALNNQLATEREKWSQEIEALREAKLELEARKDALEAQIDELKTFIEGSQINVDEAIKKLSVRSAEFKYEMELSKRMVVLHEREIQLLRQVMKNVQDTHVESSKKVKELENKLIREKEQYNQSRRAQQHQIDNSVSIAVNDATAVELAVITAKYRTLLNEQVFQKKEKMEQKQMEFHLENLKKENEKFKKNWMEEKEKVISLQSSISVLSESQLDENSKIYLLSKQIASVESREFIAKQRENHAVNMFESAQNDKAELLLHLQEVEDANRRLMQDNLALQEKEIQLQSQIATGSSVQQQKLQQEIEDLKKEKEKLVLEVQRLEGLLRVSQTQLEHFKLRCESAETEANEERMRQKDLAALSEEKTLIAILHVEVAQVKVLNQKLKAELEEAHLNLSKSSMELAKALYEMEEREISFNKIRDYHKQRANQLLLIIKDLRIQFTGAVPLPQQERMLALTDELSREKKQLEENLEQAKEDRREASLLLQEIKAKMENIEDITKLSKTSTIPDRVILEWSKRLEEVRLANVHLREKLSLLEEEEPLLRTHLKTKEERCSELAEQLGRLERLWVEQQRVWEEEQINMQDELGVFYGPALTVHQESKVNFDNELKSVLELKENEIELLKETIETLENKLRVKENEIRNLNDANNSRSLHQQEEEEESKSSESRESSNSSDPKNPCFEVILNGLKERIRIGEEALADCKSLLKKSHTELRDKSLQHQREIDYMSEEKKRLETKIRDLQSEINDIPVRYSKSQKSSTQMLEMQTLQDTISSIEKRLEKANGEKRLLESNLSRMEIELSVSKRERNEERQQTEMACEIKIQQIQRENDRLNKQISNLQEEKDLMKKEVKTIQENAIKSPSLILRTLVEKLRDQLIEKEKQISSLSRTLEDLQEKITNDECEDKISVKDKPVRDCDHASFDQPDNKELNAKIMNLEVINAKLEFKLKEYSDFNDIKAELETLKEKYFSVNSQKMKLDKDLRISKRRNEELKGQITTFIEKDKTESEEMIKKREARQANIEKSVMEWDVKKKLEVTIKNLRDKTAELENSLKDTKIKLGTSLSLMERFRKEKLTLKDKLTKLNKILAENLCSVCFKTSNMNLNRTYTIEHSEAEVSQMAVAEETKEEREETCSKCELWMKEKSYTDNKLKESVQKTKEMRDAKLDLEKRFSEALDEINALRKNNDRLKEHIKSIKEQRSRSLRPSSAVLHRGNSAHTEEGEYPEERKFPPGMSGATLVLNYEARITSLEQELREKTRLQEHVKKVLEEALLREEKLYKGRDSLLQKIAILESVKDDTEEAKLVAELRTAKVTINRLHREIEATKKPLEASSEA